MAGPGVGIEDLVEGGMGDNFVFVHCAADGLGNLREVDAAIDEGINGNFVGGVKDCGKCAADFAGFAGELEGWETFGIRFFEGEAAEFREIGLDASAWRSVGIGQRVLNRQAHVRRGKLGEHGAINKFDHRMNDALRMDDDGDARHFDFEQPASFDHLEAFVEEGCGIDGDFAAHHPGRMFQSTFDSDVREFFFGCGAKRSAGSGEPKFADGSGGFAVETLKDGGMFAVHGEDADAMFARFVHHDFAGHDKNFFRSDRDIFAGANRGESGAETGSADDGNEDDVRARHGGKFDETVGAGGDISRATQFVAQLLRLGRVDNGNGFGPVLAGLFEEKFKIISCAEADEANAVREVLGDLDRAGADRACAAEEDHVFHEKDGVMECRNDGAMVRK